MWWRGGGPWAIRTLEERRYEIPLLHSKRMDLLTRYVILVGQGWSSLEMYGHEVLHETRKHCCKAFYGHNLSEAQRWGHMGSLKVGVWPVVREGVLSGSIIIAMDCGL